MDPDIDTAELGSVITFPLMAAPADQGGAPDAAEPHRVSRAPTGADAAIGRRIRELRRAAGMTLKDLALLVRVTSVQLHRYETGVTRVAASRLLTIASALRVRPEQIVGYAELPPESEQPERLRDEVAELTRVFAGIKDQRHRTALLSLAKSMSEGDRSDP